MAGADEVVAFLSRPEAYGLAGEEVVQEETHAARVFLAGDRAYKMKKAVAFSYLDFRTLEQRKAALEAEDRLNRRTAPDLYRGLVPVTRDAGGALRIGGDGAAVEWLLVMRRFDGEQRLDRIAARGPLDERLCEKLADAALALHRTAEAAPGHAAPEDVRRVLLGNIGEIRTRGGAFVPAADLDRLERESLAALDRLTPVIAARGARGCVKRCHGDLHAGNVFVEDGTPVLFDCIEFGDDFACIDTIYDLAFLLMDLDARGQRAAANLVLSRYVARLPWGERIEELDGLALLPLHLSMRAAVRAKVAAPLGDAASVRRYLVLALDYLAPPAPVLAAIGGLQGTGKTTLARALAPQIGPRPGAVVLRSDELRKSRFEISPEERLGAEAYTPAVTQDVYRHMRRCAAAALAAGHAVAADAVHARPEERDGIEAVARAAGAAFAGFWLEGGDPAGRLRARGPDASDATLDVLAAQQARDTGPIAWIRLDAGLSPAEVLRRSSAALAAG